MCTGPDTLKIKIDGYWYNCPWGETLDPDNYGGKLTCPETNDICEGTALDSSWPEFISVEPDHGEPGTAVTITGKRLKLSLFISNRLFFYRKNENYYS